MNRQVSGQDRFLGTTATTNGAKETDINKGLNKARRAFRRL